MLNLKKISFILATIVMSVIAGYLVFAWSEPTAVPPGANVPAPINVGTVTQHKAGEIGATLFRDRDNTAWFVDPAGNSMFQGNVGIGTTTPAAPLHVTGNVIAAAPTASNHVATRGWVEAQTSGGGVLTLWGSVQRSDGAAGEGTPPCPIGWTQAYAGWGWIPTQMPGHTSALQPLGMMHCNATRITNMSGWVQGPHFITMIGDTASGGQIIS